MIDLDQARRDLETKSPEVFTRLYGARLIEELEAHRAKTGQLTTKLLIQSRNVGAAIRAFTEIKRFLDAFARVTGWSPDRAGGRPKQSERNWQAAQGLAREVTKSARAFFETTAKPLVDPKPEPEPEEAEAEETSAVN